VVGASIPEINSERIARRLQLRWLLGWFVFVLVCVTIALGLWLWQQGEPLRQMRGAVQKRHWNDALRRALSYLANHPQDAEAIRIVARSFSGLGQNAQAEMYFDRAGELGIEDLRLRGEVLIELNRPTQAVEVLAELRARGDNDPAVIQRLAVLQFQRGNHEEAFELAEQLGKEFPTHTALAWCVQATFHVSLRHAQQAIDCLQEALRLNPQADKLGLDPGTVKMFMGAAWMDLGKNDQARDWLQAAVEHTQTAEAHWYLGEAELGCGNLRAADQCWHRALELDGNYFNALFSIGKLSLQENRPLEALEWLNLADRQGRQSSALQTALSRANARIGHEDVAAEHARRAEDLRAKESEERDERRLLSQYPQHLQSRLLLTRKTIERGNIAEAKAMVDELLRQHPNSPELRDLRKSLDNPETSR